MLVSAGGFKGLFDLLKKNGMNLEGEVGKFLAQESGLFSIAKFAVKKLEAGHAELTFPYSHEVARHGGMVHGGIISFALDTAGGLAIMPTNEGIDQVTLELKINFLEPLKKEPYRIVGKMLRRGRTIATAEAEALDGDGHLCAKALGTWYMISTS